MYRWISAACCLVCLIAVVDRIALAEESDEEKRAEPSLLQLQSETFRIFRLARAEGDFAGQARILRPLSQQTRERDRELKLSTADEIDHHIQDLEKVASFSPEQLKLAKEELACIHEGSAYRVAEDCAAAIPKLKRSAELAEQLYGLGSFAVIHAKRVCARAIRQHGVNREEGIEMASSAAKKLEELGLTDFFQYYDLQMTLTRSHFEAGNEDEAIKAGLLAMKLHQQWEIAEGDEFNDIVLMITHALNQQENREEALRIASYGKICTVQENLKDPSPYFELYRECGRAYLATERTKEAKNEFEMLIYHAEKVEGFSQEKQLEYLQEYSGLLEKLGDQKRLASVAEERDRLQRKLNGEVEYVGQKSRYTN